MTPHEITWLLISLGTILALALILGELARWTRQPAVLGEILAGVLLGPTILGRIAPALHDQLFPAQGPGAIALKSLTSLALALFMLVAGMELDLLTMRRQGRLAIKIGSYGIIVPFALGFLVAWLNPNLMGREGGSNPLIFALFIATAFSLSAWSVITKTLIDLNLYRTDLGMTIATAAFLNDVFGWIVFSAILSLMGNPGSYGAGFIGTIISSMAFTAVILVGGRWLLHYLIPWLQAYLSWPAGVICFSLILALMSAALTEWIGVRAIFGTFLVGVVIGDSPHVREQTRTTLRQFIAFIFAPLFFASIGLHIDFIARFRWEVVFTVLLVATLGKVLGCEIGARRCGLPWREAWAVAFGLNARGGMVIILAHFALQYGVIRQRLFVALVIMALATSIMSGPAITRLLKRQSKRRFFEYLTSRTFINHLQATDRQEVIHELALVAAHATELPVEKIEQAAWMRESMISSGHIKGVAVPCAQMEELTDPVLVLGISPGGVDFDSPDGSLAQIIILLLTPIHDNIQQVELLSDIRGTLSDAPIMRQTLHASNFVQFLALMKAESKSLTQRPELIDAGLR